MFRRAIINDHRRDDETQFPRGEAEPPPHPPPPPLRRKMAANRIN